ncbi:protein tyrosine phosphatase [Paenibacillus sp. LHD-38]|uniref:low molecular weight protein tyrosine phosphatase family protein n=1 Tax=Paenibacillus sp. LHD-38 TaxID=3072143 RepID=UPI002810209F|nr:protein tyrosine phosphatase [Paenibacillus sp. LHD-38]MDQ8733230.1 protein tyrosine phosphatase [Paenibacillus sp. LHD-38]
MHLLFVCSRNKWRSLTAETIFQGVGGHEVRSAGTEENARIKVTAGHIGWADLIFAMEKKHIRRLQDKFGYELAGKRLICLHIPDEFEYMNEDLIGMLQSSVSLHIDQDD